MPFSRIRDQASQISAARRLYGDSDLPSGEATYSSRFSKSSSRVQDQLGHLPGAWYLASSRELTIPQSVLGAFEQLDRGLDVREIGGSDRQLVMRDFICATPSVTPKPFSTV